MLAFVQGRSQQSAITLLCCSCSDNTDKRWQLQLSAHRQCNASLTGSSSSNLDLGLFGLAKQGVVGSLGAFPHDPAVTQTSLCLEVSSYDCANMAASRAGMFHATDTCRNRQCSSVRLRPAPSFPAAPLISPLSTEPSVSAILPECHRRRRRLQGRRCAVAPGLKVYDMTLESL